jgi:hypothetical protein
MPHDVFSFLASLGQLQTLELHLPVRGFPQAIWMLPDLATLSLCGFTAMELPDEFAELAKLTKLELVDCGLERVPPVICRCTGASLCCILPCCCLHCSRHTAVLPLYMWQS